MDRRIFVSCGQENEEEISLGRQIKKVIDDQARMEGFFAQDVHSPADLNRAVFEALKMCDGFFAVIQKRGAVTYRNYAVVHRSSVWIQQEIALVCYRMYLENSQVPIRVYYQTGILLEGLMKTSIVNPIPFEQNSEILAGLSKWLQGPEFDEHPVLTRRKSLFQTRVAELQEIHWLLLELIAAHTATPGESLLHTTIHSDFDEIMKIQIPEVGERKDTFNRSLKSLLQSGLIERITDPQMRGEKVAIGKQWWDLVLRELKRHGRMD